MEDWNDYSNHTLGLLVDALYRHKWTGDTFLGPGDCTISVDATLKNAFLFPSCFLFTEKENP